MDSSPELFAYRCLPLGMANAYGWEMLCPVGFSAIWNGGPAPDDVVVSVDAGGPTGDAPEALFGLGTFTIHVPGILRTDPGWDLWVGGPPNTFKDGVAPLSGLIETDWSPYTFTMNWRLTRPHHPVRFEANEPFAFFFPVERGGIEQVQPRCLPIDAEARLRDRFEAWSASRNQFQHSMIANPPTKPSEKWQKFYYRGVDADGCPGTVDHRTKLRVQPFADAPLIPPSPTTGSPPPGVSQPSPLAKRDWVLRMLERQRQLSTDASTIFRVAGIEPQTFLDEFYALNRPVVLCGELDGSRALREWSADSLRKRVGASEIECQVGRSSNTRYERDKDTHRRTMPFCDYMDLIEENPGNGAYITAFNQGRNSEALAPLMSDVPLLERFMDTTAIGAHGMMWIGPEGTFTPLHHDLTNNFLIQLVGRKRVVLAAPGETQRLYNDEAVFSAIDDLESPDFTVERFPLAAGLATHVIELQPGEILFLPVGWWHQVRSLDFSVSITRTNFIWPNDVWQDYPT